MVSSTLGENKSNIDNSNYNGIQTVMDTVHKTMECLGDNHDTNKVEYNKKYTELDSLSQPVLRHLYKARKG